MREMRLGQRRRAGIIWFSTLVATATAVVIAAAAQNAPRQVSIVVSGGTVVSVDAAANVFNPGAVAIDGNSIVAVGPAADIATRFRGTEQINTPLSLSTRLNSPKTCRSFVMCSMTSKAQTRSNC